MIDSLFGTETPLLVKLVVAFGVVLGLIAMSTWALRRVGGSRLGVTTPRGRQPRLAVIDAAAVDTRRRLVLIRRDNVEHLIMIGGPTDVVVEQNIVRAVPVSTPRDHSAPRAPGADMPGAGHPEAPLRAQEPPRAPQSLNLPRAPQQAEPPSRAPLSVEAMFGAAADMSRPPRAESHPRRQPSGEPPRPMRPRPPAARNESELPTEVHQAPPTADTNLADMALRLEEALKRPGARKEPEARPPQQPRKDAESPKQLPSTNDAPNAGTPRAEIPRAEGPPAPTDAAANNARSKPPAGAPRADAAAADATDPKSVFDSLEEEMASLLNRPPGKD
jgi:hypothetical protein